jgi:ArsR family transcriptional regulator
LADSAVMARMFKVLSVPTRVRIVEMLKHHPLCVNAISQRLGITAAAASQHLRIMRDADVVTAEKEGYFVHYRLNRDTLREWKRLADRLFTAKED